MLTPCPRCRRHVRAHEPRCPFCARRGDVRGAIAVGALLLGCAATPGPPLAKRAPREAVAPPAVAADDPTPHGAPATEPSTPPLEPVEAAADPAEPDAEIERAHAERRKRRWRRTRPGAGPVRPGPHRPWRPGAEAGDVPLYGGV